MDSKLQALLFVVSMAISAAVFVPLFLAINKAARRRRENFLRFSEECGCKVTAYYLRGSARESHDGGRYTASSGKYVYYGTDNKKYTKRLSSKTSLSRAVTLYLDPNNPRKAYTEYQLRTGSWISIVMTLMYPAILAGGMVLFRAFSSFLG